jgi:hypothetical protein
VCSFRVDGSASEGGLVDYNAQVIQRLLMPRVQRAYG